MQEVVLVLILTGFACSVLGPFIVLRKLSMMADALSHTVLLGIVLAFFLVKDLQSPALIIGAGLFGLITVLTTELLAKKKLAKHDDALGVIFPLFLSIAILVISKYFRNAHIDSDMVLMGNPLFIPFIRMWGLPKSGIIMGTLFALNSVFVFIFVKPLTIATFDRDFAKMKGIKITLLFYTLMALMSFTCVSAFDSVGAILVISFFVAPATMASLFTKHITSTILFSLIITALHCVVGCFLAILMNVSISGMCSFLMMLSLFITVIIQKIKYKIH